jgi:hypothetical protein
MRICKVLLFFFAISVVSTIDLKAQSNPPKASYVVVPSSSVILTVASQPDCPVEIAESKLLNLADGSRRAAFQYQLVNRGTKPIKYVSVYAINSTGTGGGPLYNGHILQKPLMPGEKIITGELTAKIIEPSPELTVQLRLSGPLRAIVVLLVENIEFTDGSVFSGMKTVKELQNYFVDINSEEINSRANGVGFGAVKSPIPE